MGGLVMNKEWNDCATHYAKKLKILTKLFVTKKNEMFFTYVETREKILTSDDPRTIMRMINVLPTFRNLDSFREIIRKDMTDADNLLRAADDSENELYQELKSAYYDASVALSDYDEELRFLCDDYSDRNYNVEWNTPISR